MRRVLLQFSVRFYSASWTLVSMWTQINEARDQWCLQLTASLRNVFNVMIFSNHVYCIKDFCRLNQWWRSFVNESFFLRQFFIFSEMAKRVCKTIWVNSHLFVSLPHFPSVSTVFQLFSCWIVLGFDTNFRIRFDSDSQACSSIRFPIRFDIDYLGYTVLCKSLRPQVFSPAKKWFKVSYFDLLL